jgi:transposase
MALPSSRSQRKKQKVSRSPPDSNRPYTRFDYFSVKQKVSGCFRSEDYAHAYCRISSYIQTMANKGYNPLIAIQIALAGQATNETGE